MYFITLIFIACITISSPYAIAQQDDAEQIIGQSFENKRVDDQISKLTFLFDGPNKDKQEVIYTMVWKNMHGEDGFDSKAMFFTESPPEKKGIAYLGWLRPDGSAKNDDEWVYLPELRSTRRLAHRDHEHNHDDDEFGNSILTTDHLEPRLPELDDHEFIGEKSLEGKSYYLIRSTPKIHINHGSAHQGNTTFRAIIRWIEKDTYLIQRKQFLNENDAIDIDMQIAWVEVQGFWLWHRISAINPKNNNTTIMTVSETQINLGLKNKDFSKRMLKKGVARLRK